MPPPPLTSDIEIARKKANLRVLQRLDSTILDVAGSATHVVLYEFSEVEQRWEKRNVEGSLFVTKRSDSPRFKLIVLNRNSTENLEVKVTESFQMQVREPYLIFREGTSKDRSIRGIWFHDDSERSVVSELLEKIVKSEATAAEREAVHSTPVSGGVGGTTGGGGGGGDSLGSGAATEVDAGAAASALLSPLTLQESSTSASAASPVPPATSTTTTTPPPSSASSSHPSQQRHDHHHRNPSPSQQQHNHNHPPRNLVLDKKSLQLSLMSLIQDERFLDLIHAQYLKVAHARANKDGGGGGGGATHGGAGAGAGSGHPPPHGNHGGGGGNGGGGTAGARK